MKHRHAVRLPDGQVINTELAGLWLNQMGGPGAPQLFGAPHAWGPPVPMLAGAPRGSTWQLGQAAPPVAMQQPMPSPDTQLGTGAYATLTLLAATAGGATVGFISSGEREGAVTGAAFTGGFSALSSAALFGREGNPGGALMMGALGILALGSALWRFGARVEPRGGRSSARRR